jgi:serine/threonine protein kinase
MASSLGGDFIDRQIGSYRIVSLLGQGGQGRVYRATDLDLQRDVALKILPAALTADSVRRERLVSEAKVLGTLNHPNIVHVHRVGTVDGLTFIDSELIDGTPLRDEIARAPLPVKRIIAIAAQVADGLAAAHEAGVVHRDIKPENIVIGRDGRPKIVDFGLANPPIDDGPPQGVATTIQTETQAPAGTAAYMSPEQARGAATNFRTDQFSLGLVMYELATGVQAFRGETREKTLSAVIADEPRPIAELNPRVPAGLRWVIERCLAKDPGDRYGSTLDLAHDLRALRDRLAEMTGTSSEPAPVRPRGGFGLGWSTAILATGVAAGVCLSTTLFPGIDLGYQYLPVATSSSFQSAPAWSPDGKHLAYVADVNGVTQVFTRAIGSSEEAQPRTSRKFDCYDPFWSPDGTEIYFISLSGEHEALWSVNAVTGEPRKLIDNVSVAAASGDTLALLRSTGGSPGHETFTLWTANTTDGNPNPQRYTRPPFDALPVESGALHFSPDGSRLGVSAQNRTGIAPTTAEHTGPHFWSIALAAPAERQVHEVFMFLPDLPSGAFQFSWWPDSRHVVAAINDLRTGSHLWMLDVDSDNVRRFTAGPLRDNFPAVSKDGKQIAYAQEIVDFDLFEVPLDGSPLKPGLATSRNELSPSWSRTRQQYAYETDRNGRREIMMRQEPTRAGGAPIESPVVTPDDFSDGPVIYLGGPAISPDGTLIAFERSGPTARWRIYVKSLLGGTIAPLYQAPVGVFDDQPMWSPDSEWVTFNEAIQVAGNPGRYRLMKASVKSHGPPELLLDEITDDSCPWSDDSNWIACQTPKGLVLVSPDGQRQRVVTDLFFLAFGWASDSGTIYGIRVGDDGRSMSLWAVDIRTGHEKVITPNLGTVPRLDVPVRGFSRVGDRAFLTSIVHVKSDIWMLEGFPGPPALFERWFSRLRAGR